QRAETHARNGDGDLQLNRLLGKASAQYRLGDTLLAIAFEWIARQGCREEHQVVKTGNRTLGSKTADVVEALLRSAVDIVKNVPVIQGTFFQIDSFSSHRLFPNP